MRTVFGIDPGLASTGYGIVRIEGNRPVHLDHGVINTPSDMPTGERLCAIYDALRLAIGQWHPTEAAMEGLYFVRNISSAIPVAQAMGVACLLLTQEGISVHYYSPTRIKQTIVGIGRASKWQVKELVRLLLGLRKPPASNHAADALAAALCHCNWSNPLLDRSVGVGRAQTDVQ